MSEKRELVIEHRITVKINGFTIRLWIESDPEYGGKSSQDAWSAMEQLQSSDDLYGLLSPLEQALIILESIPSANSVEVCDADGNGTAVHRDWP